MIKVIMNNKDDGDDSDDGDDDNVDANDDTIIVRA
jgi:hypothetical protein